MQPRRLRGLPWTLVLGRAVPVATGVRSRLLGLALLSRERAGPGLLIPRCRSVHTIGMRFELDVVFLDRAGRPLREVRSLVAGRFVRHGRAWAVLEVPSPQAAGTAHAHKRSRV